MAALQLLEDADWEVFGKPVGGLFIWARSRMSDYAHVRTQAQLERIPYMFVVGDKEVEADGVSVRVRAGADVGFVPLAEAARIVRDAVEEPFKRGGMSYSFS